MKCFFDYSLPSNSELVFSARIICFLTAFTVFTPNPFTADVNIGFYSKSKGMSVITLYDIAGNKLKETEYYISENVNFVNWDDLSGLPAGIYIVKIRSGDAFLIYKIVKK